MQPVLLREDKFVQPQQSNIAGIGMKTLFADILFDEAI